MLLAASQDHIALQKEAASSLDVIMGLDIRGSVLTLGFFKIVTVSLQVAPLQEYAVYGYLVNDILYCWH